MVTTRFSYRWLLPASLVLGWLLLPILAFVAGQLAIGPYQGARGLGSFLSDVYGAVLNGEVLAMVLVFAPALLLAIWYLQARLRRLLAREAAENGHHPAKT